MDKDPDVTDRADRWKQLQNWDIPAESGHGGLETCATHSRRRFLGNLAAGAVQAGARPAPRTNVLFIIVDDLRPCLGCYGEPVVKSPNIDRLGRHGIVFTNTFCQQAVCNPSRSTIFTGLRPDSTRVYENATHFRSNLPSVVTLPQMFRQSGYQTRGIGKVFHDGVLDPVSWSTPQWPQRNAGMQYVDIETWHRSGGAAGVANAIPTLTWKKRESWQAPDVPDNALQDGQVAERSVQALRDLKDRTFFLAVGFQKPHLPFVAPKRYFDLYRPEEIPEIPNPFPPKDAPSLALHHWDELRGYNDIPKDGPLPPGKARELRHGYYAGISYTDTQIGKVLDELERLHLVESTLVVLTADHGWHLGEQDLWAKTTNFELDTRVPLILACAGVKSAGSRCSGLMESVDIYPTVADVCGLTVPEGLEGRSASPLLSRPDRSWKDAAFSQFPRPWSARRAGPVMGRSLRTERYRYTQWREADGPLQAEELYDHQGDGRESVNIAGRPENRKLIAELGHKLALGWRGVRFPGSQR